MQNTVFTIGHSTHNVSRFIALLLQHKITALCDVRSQPYSRINPQFNREPLKEALKHAGIAYVFLGDELGARTIDKSCYENGRVIYERIARTSLFSKGLDRIEDGLSKYRISLVCAEKEPLNCHRTILIARQVECRGIPVSHIHADGTLETNEHAINRLIRSFSLPDMFLPQKELIAEAYRLQEEKIAYIPPDRAESSEPEIWERAAG
jgi:uncharacterized protein (DUF488 family)